MSYIKRFAEDLAHERMLSQNRIRAMEGLNPFKDFGDFLDFDNNDWFAGDMDIAIAELEAHILARLKNDLSKEWPDVLDIDNDQNQFQYH